MLDLFFGIEGDGVYSGWVTGAHSPGGNDLAQVTGLLSRRNGPEDLGFGFVVTE